MPDGVGLPRNGTALRRNSAGLGRTVRAWQVTVRVAAAWAPGACSVADSSAGSGVWWSGKEESSLALPFRDHARGGDLVALPSSRAGTTTRAANPPAALRGTHLRPSHNCRAPISSPP